MTKLTKIFKIKGIGFILLAFAAGIILLLMPEEKEETYSTHLSSSQYGNALEKSLEKLLKSATGHECKVMISLTQGYSYTYATNEKLDSIYSNGEVTSKTVSKEYVIISSGGNEQLVVLKENLPKIKGVAIVCKKGDNADKDEIISIVCSLFELEAENVGCFVGR